MKPGDETLNKLYAKQNFLDIQIKKRKVEIAKKNREVVDSIEELVCEKHPDARFQVIKEIRDSFIFAMGKKSLNVYQCVDCGEDETAYEKSKAYDCPICGIVMGEFNTVHYRSSEESWRALAGRQGDHYYCRICETQLGHHYWMVS